MAPNTTDQSANEIELHTRSHHGDRDDEGANPTTNPDSGSERPREGSREGWQVVAAATTIFFVTLGLVYSFGVMQAVLIARGYASASTLGWVSSLVVALVSALAVPCTWVVSRIGSRNTGLIGALLAGASQFATSYTFAAPVWTLFVAQLVFGLSYALEFWACNQLAAQYFDKRKGLALGIVYSGSGVGGAVFSIALSQLERAVSLEWGVRILAVFAWLTLIPASLLLKERSRPVMSVLNRRLFRNVNFLLCMLVAALSSFSLFVPPFFLPTYAESAGYSAAVGAYLVAGYNLASAFGRIGFGLLSDWRGSVTSLTVAMTLMGISILTVWTVSGSNLGLLVFFLILNGASSGALLSLQPAINASLFGLAEMGATMSMITTARTFGAAVGSPAAGFLLDSSKDDRGRLTIASFRPALLLIGGVLMLSSFILLVLRVRLAGYDLRKKV